MTEQNKKAFTLAEVLITLGIIGVVAALTIPNLIKNHEKHVIEVGLKKTYSDIENMIRRSEADNDQFMYWDFYLDGDAFIDKYITPYMKLEKCQEGLSGNALVKSGSCFEPNWTYNIGGWRNPNGEFVGITGENLYARRFLMQDGRAIAIFPYNSPDGMPDGTIKYRGYITFFVDVNGYRGNSTLGKDVFIMSIYTYNQGQKNYGKLMFADRSLGANYGAMSEEKMINDCVNKGVTCGLILQRNGWKFPKDYPIKF